MENILDKIYSSVLSKPETYAIVCSGKKLSYKQLWDDSDALSVYMSRTIAHDKSPVIVYGHKDPLMLVCFLACMKSGHAYVPVDTSIPEDRASDIISQTCAPLILAVEDINYEKNCLNKDALNKIIQDYGGLHPDKEDRICGGDLIYIIFTSGSTGKPKGVQITHNCIIHFLDWALTLGGVKKDVVYINQAPFSFDLSVYELYMSLVSAGTLFCLKKELMSDMKLLFENFAVSQAEIWVSTPSFADMCLADKSFGDRLMPNIKMFLFCGETLLNNTVSRLHQRFSNAVVVNTYGPTESTVAVTDVVITEELNAS